MEDLRLSGLDAGREVRTLSLAERQLVEIARAISWRPRLLILDEATSALSPHEVTWVLETARRLAGEGTAVLFISHRLAEVRRVADQVTVCRGGRAVLTDAIGEVDDDALIAAMLGRKPSRLYPPREGVPSQRVALCVRGLRDSRKLRGIDLDLHEGEILGIGGLQGQGQAELLLALCGAERAQGSVEIDGRARHLRDPRHALASGIAILPEDRSTQGLLLSKSIRDNAVLATLRQDARFGFRRPGHERERVRAIMTQLNLVAQSIEQPASALSGGNQQKVVVGKVLLTGARILLLYDPTRGVDVGTKAEMFGLMRRLAADGYSLLFDSTDHQELVNMADRVAVVSGGRVVSTLADSALSEESIIRASVADTPQESSHTAGHGDAPAMPRARSRARVAAAAGLRRVRWTTVMPFAILIALIVLYASKQSGVLTLSELNITAQETLTLVLIAAGQMLAIYVGGIDLSVGGVVSLTTVVAATYMGTGGAQTGLVFVGILAGGLALGALNGLVVTALRMEPFIVTLATWSVWSGAALLVRHTDGGQVPAVLTNFGTGYVAGVANAVWLILLLGVAWWFFTRTRTGIAVRCVGSDRRAAHLAGVPVARMIVTAFAMAGLCAALGGLFLITQTSTGSPTAGNEFILNSVAVAVIGGTALAGGRANVAGTIAAAFILTLIGNVVFAFNLPTGWQVALPGLLLIAAVLGTTIPKVIGGRRVGL